MNGGSSPIHYYYHWGSSLIIVSEEAQVSFIIITVAVMKECELEPWVFMYNITKKK